MNRFPIAHKLRRKVAARFAFTIIELLIVLVILAAFASMALPRLTRAFGRSELQRAAQQLVEDLSSARVFAIENGVTYEVYRDTNGTTYTVQPQHCPASPTVAARTAGGAAASRPIVVTGNSGSNENRSSPATSPALDTIENEFAYGIAFAAKSLADESDDPNSIKIDGSTQLGKRLAERATVREDLVQPTGEEAKTRIARYYPDGRADGSTIRLRSSDGYQIELRIRRLTGGVKVAKVEREPETDSTASDSHTGSPPASPNN